MSKFTPITLHVNDKPSFVETLIFNPVAFWITFVVVCWLIFLAVALFVGKRSAQNGFFKDEAPPVPDRKGRRLRSVK